MKVFPLGKYIFILVFLLLLILVPAAVNNVESHQLTFKVVRVKTTAYYKPPATNYKEIKLNGKGITYSGKRARVGFAAADLKVFPLGTVIDVPGHGIVVVEDKGSAVRGYHLDLFMGNGEQGRKRAFRWGKKNLKVKVY